MKNDDLISRCFGRLPVAAFDRVEEKMMYESPITRFAEDIMTDIVEREEGYLVESVHRVGFDIDKEELEKALRYDRDQYEKGFHDGRLAASPRWIPCSERLPERGVSVLISHVGYVSEDYLDIDDGAMYFWNSGIDLDEELNNLAWMPLPAPWKGEADGHS